MADYSLKAVNALNLQALNGDINIDAGASHVVLYSHLGFSGVSNVDIRSDLGVAIGTDVQAYSVKLDIFAAQEVTDGNMLVSNGTYYLANSKSDVRTNLGLVIGTDVQAYSARLDDIATAAPTDNYFVRGNGTNFVAEAVTASDVGAQPLTDALTDLAEAGVVSAANQYLFSTAAGTWGFGTVSTYGRSLMDDSDAGTARETLGLTNGSATVSFNALTSKLQKVKVDAKGEIEWCELVASTADATPTVMTIDGNTEKNAMAIGQVSSFELTVCGRRAKTMIAAEKVLVKKFHFVMDREDSASTAMLSSTNDEEVYRSSSIAGVNITCAANTSDFTLDVTVTGEASKDYIWVGSVKRVNISA